MTGKRYLTITREAIPILFHNGTRKVSDGLPKDARLIMFNYNATNDTFDITFESDCWPSTEEGFYLYQISPISTRIDERDDTTNIFEIARRIRKTSTSSQYTDLLIRLAGDETK